MNTPIILIWRWSSESILKVDYVRRQNVLDLERTHSGHSTRLGIDDVQLRTTRSGVRISPGAPIIQTLTTDYRTVRSPIKSNSPNQNAKSVTNWWSGAHQWVCNFRGRTVVDLYRFLRATQLN